MSRIRQPLLFCTQIYKSLCRLRKIKANVILLSVDVLIPNMRILDKDPGTNSIKMMLETDEDMWHLYNVIETGDLVIASTTRREEKSADKLRAEKMEKKKDDTRDTR